MAFFQFYSLWPIEQFHGGSVEKQGAVLLGHNALTPRLDRYYILYIVTKTEVNIFIAPCTMQSIAERGIAKLMVSVCPSDVCPSVYQ